MTDYKVLSAGVRRPVKYGREIGERSIVLRLKVGQRPKLEFLPLTETETLRLAQQLIDSVIQMHAFSDRITP